MHLSVLEDATRQNTLAASIPALAWPVRRRAELEILEMK